MCVQVSLVLILACRPRVFVWVGLVPVLLSSTCISLFPDFHVSLPFDNFTMGVLRTLNVAPTKLHPNTWASMKAFRLLCDVLRLHPSPSYFLSYYTSHPANHVLWHSLISQSGNIIFNSFTTSYKNSRRGSSRFIFDRRRRPTLSMRLVGRGSPFIGLTSLVILRNGLGRSGVMRN